MYAHSILKKKILNNNIIKGVPPLATCGCKNWESPSSASPREGWGGRREIFTPGKGREEVLSTKFSLLSGYLLTLLPLPGTLSVGMSL